VFLPGDLALRRGQAGVRLRPRTNRTGDGLAGVRIEAWVWPICSRLNTNSKRALRNSAGCDANVAKTSHSKRRAETNELHPTATGFARSSPSVPAAKLFNRLTRTLHGPTGSRHTMGDISSSKGRERTRRTLARGWSSTCSVVVGLSKSLPSCPKLDVAIETFTTLWTASPTRC
jgi:hypothetical protein